MKKLIYILLIAVLSSCVTQEKCYRKFPPSTEKKIETIIEYKDTIITGGSITHIINKDSLVFLPGEVKRYIDTSGAAMLSFYKNEYGQLVAHCEAKDKKIQGLNKEIRERQTTVEILPPIHEKFVPWWLYAILGITTVLAIPTAIKLIKTMFI